MKYFIAIVTGALWLLTCHPASAEQTAFALIIGNNSPPSEHADTLPTLRFADDDAIRYYHFFKRMTDHVRLLTVPDEQTQRRYPGIAAQAEAPTVENVKRAARDLSALIEASKQRREETVVYLVYSGHGTKGESGKPYFALIGGTLSGQLLHSELLSVLSADYQHLLVDACNAEGVIGTRGMFDREADGRRVAITGDDVERILKENLQSEHVGLGLLISSSANNESHEWSEIESGVFTHEVLSGLAGPADVNLDGKVEYSELTSFIAAANRAVADPRGKIDVIAIPPKRNQSVPLIDLASLEKVAFVEGNPSGLGHFFIELENGERYLDANLSKMKMAHIAVPSDSRAYLRTETHEAELALGAHGVIQLGELKMAERGLVSRGSVESSLRRGLFVTAFGRDYYEGFVDSSGFVGVSFDGPRLSLSNEAALEPGTHAAYRKTISIGSFAVAGAAAVAAITLGALSLKAKADYQATDLQLDSHEANEQYKKFGTGAWVCGAFAPVAFLAGWLLWPGESSSNTPVQVSLHQTGGLDVQLRVNF